MTGIVSKLTDSLSMFWQSLDDDERRIVAYAVAYVLVSVMLGVQAAARQRRERALRDEVSAILREHAEARS